MLYLVKKAGKGKFIFLADETIGQSKNPTGEEVKKSLTKKISDYWKHIVQNVSAHHKIYRICVQFKVNKEDFDSDEWEKVLSSVKRLHQFAQLSSWHISLPKGDNLFDIIQSFKFKDCESGNFKGINCSIKVLNAIDTTETIDSDIEPADFTLMLFAQYESNDTEVVAHFEQSNISIDEAAALVFTAPTSALRVYYALYGI